MAEQYRNIGKIVSTFGVKGQLILTHHLGNKINPAKIKVIFIEEKKNSFLPYFVQEAKIKSSGEMYLFVEGIDSKEAGARLLRKEAWLREEEMTAHSSKTEPIYWVGYQLYDQDRDLGEILEVIEQPHQILCRLEISGKEVLIPVNDSTRKNIDHKHRKLFLILPEGLLDVYLS
jgi:16S rRNA processing protein RimM